MYIFFKVFTLLMGLSFSQVIIEYSLMYDEEVKKKQEEIQIEKKKAKQKKQKEQKEQDIQLSKEKDK